MTKNEWIDTLNDADYEIYDDLVGEIGSIEAEIHENMEILKNPADYLDDWDYETHDDIERYSESIQEEIDKLENELEDLYQKLNDFEASNGFEAA